MDANYAKRTSLAPCLTRSSATMVYIVCVGQPGQWEMMSTTRALLMLKNYTKCKNIFFMFPHNNSTHKGLMFTLQKMYLVMECCGGGELSDVLKERHHFPENQARIIMKQLASAIHYLHKNGELRGTQLKQWQFRKKTELPGAHKWNIVKKFWGVISYLVIQSGHNFACHDSSHTNVNFRIQ